MTAWTDPNEYSTNNELEERPKRVRNVPVPSDQASVPCSYNREQLAVLLVADFHTYYHPSTNATVWNGS